MPSTTPSQFRPEALKASIELLAQADPARIFLTHYGELAYSDRLRKLLLAQLDEYVKLAGEYAGQSQRLEEAIIDEALAQVGSLNPGQDLAAMRAHFRHDAEINAQGLAHWYERHAS